LTVGLALCSAVFYGHRRAKSSGIKLCCWQASPPFSYADAAFSQLQAIVKPGYAGQSRQTKLAQPQSGAITPVLPGSYAALPQGGNPAEESENKSGKECADWLCYAARRVLPDPEEASLHGREPGKDAQALPLYVVYCS